jgi:hypothetical protein
MEQLPSRTGLLLGRICVYIQLTLLAWWLSSVFRASGSSPILIQLPSTVLVLGLIRARVNAVAYQKRFSSSREMSAPTLEDRAFPDFWQMNWIRKSRYDQRTTACAWRTVQATLISVAAFLLVQFYLSVRFHEQASHGWPLMIGMGLIMGPMIGWFYEPRIGSSTRLKTHHTDRDDPDDLDPTGVGARVRPPTPVLSGGNKFPS